MGEARTDDWEITLASFRWNLARGSLVRGLCLLLLLVCGARAVLFTAEHWGEPWPSPRLEIDGGRYLEGARSLAVAGSLDPVVRSIHSHGFQFYLGALWRITGSYQGAVNLNKVLFLLFSIASVGLLWRLGQRFFSETSAWLGALLFASSAPVIFYVNMIQYEVLAAFLLLLWAWLWLGGRGWGRAIGAGLVLALLVWIHVRFAALLLLPLLRFLCERRRDDLVVLAVALLPLVGWSAFLSRELGVWVWLVPGNETRFQLGNHPNATGAAYPYPPFAEPGGWEFVKAHPASFLRLIGERFLLLFGWKRDLWAIPPVRVDDAWYAGWENVMGSVLFFLGWGKMGWEDWRARASEASGQRVWIHGILLLLLAPPLFTLASHRFLLPVLPLLAVLQAYFIVALFRETRRRVLAKD